MQTRGNNVRLMADSNMLIFHILADGVPLNAVLEQLLGSICRVSFTGYQLW